jgi:hypothetical protein
LIQSLEIKKNKYKIKFENYYFIFVILYLFENGRLTNDEEAASLEVNRIEVLGKNRAGK